MFDIVVIFWLWNDLGSVGHNAQRYGLSDELVFKILPPKLKFNVE